MRKSILISICALLMCILALPNLIAGLARRDLEGWPSWVYVIAIVGLLAAAIYGFTRHYSDEPRRRLRRH